MQIQPYLHFNGRCEEAIEFYSKALGAKVLMLMHFKDSPDQSMISPEFANKVMHARLQIGESTLLLSDGRCKGDLNFQGFALSFIVSDVAEAEKLFAAISNGGQVQMPLTKTFFSPSFGMAADRFGVSWMVYVGQ